jgi:hypothetical protein
MAPGSRHRLRLHNTESIMYTSVYSIRTYGMGFIPKFLNQSSHIPIERSHRVGPESQTGWRKIHALIFNEHKCPESWLLSAPSLHWNWGAWSKRPARRPAESRFYHFPLCIRGFEPRASLLRNQLFEPFFPHLNFTSGLRVIPFRILYLLD